MKSSRQVRKLLKLFLQDAMCVLFGSISINSKKEQKQNMQHLAIIFLCKVLHLIFIFIVSLS